ncbi:Glutamyl-tRNA reductase [Chlamydiales bacterium STE3]|nr:Glutamyl-tRNA reductase [Chlamydiales bacterium STE3]
MRTFFHRSLLKMRVGVIGINHKLADLNLREKLAKGCQRRFGLESSLHEGHTFLLLSTCNRTEIYFSSENLATTHTYILSILRQEVNEDFEHKLYSYFGYDCFFHLCHVTTGLDSAIVAETEIQGQVKKTYETALSHQSLPHELHYLFQKALKIAKQARSHLFNGKRMAEVEHAAYQTGVHFFKDLNAVNILFVGASEINQKLLRFFSTKQLPSITLCNRTLKKAEHYAEKYGLDILPWEDLGRWQEFDWIIFGTKASHYFIQKEQLTQYTFSKEKLIVDLSFPRNVDPRIAKDPRIILLNIDQINRMLKFRKAKLSQKLQDASLLIEQSARLYVDLFDAREKRLIAMEAACV